MSDSGFASLNPSLLARKGGAKPAMRRQHASITQAPNHNDTDLEDLGWNDMGNDTASDIGPTSATADTADIIAFGADTAPAEAAVPAVHTSQKELAKRIAKRPAKKASKKIEVKPHKKAAKLVGNNAQPKRRSALAQGKRAAFTLRLDPDRHLKLRLAATIKNISAQALVTAALDAGLAEIEELETLAAAIKQS